MADIDNEPPKSDGQDAARRIGDAGVADETAAYVDAGASASGDGQGGEAESEAHPS